MPPLRGSGIPVSLGHGQKRDLLQQQFNRGLGDGMDNHPGCPRGIPPLGSDQMPQEPRDWVKLPPFPGLCFHDDGKEREQGTGHESPDPRD